MKLFNKFFQGDRVIWMVVAMLALISLLAVYSATGTFANSKHDGDNVYVLLSHAATLLLGLVAVYMAHLLNYTYYSKILQFAFWASLPLLLFTLYFGKDYNDAQRAVYIFNVSFQSSDFAKVALIGYLARELTKRQNQVKDFKNAFVPLMLPVIIVVALIFPENFSTAALLFASCMVLLFIGRINMKYLLAFFGVVLVAMSIYILVKLNDKEDDGRVDVWFQRVESYFSHDEEKKEMSGFSVDYQEIQSKIAIAGGGLLGKSPGKSTQRNFLPLPYSDFIFAIIVEEYGLLGGSFVVLLYLILLFRAMAIMNAMPLSFGGYLSFGLAFMIVLQAMINMGVAVGLLPITGQPLPFISKGGTSLLFTGCAIGMIISVSKEVNKNKEKGNELETT